MDLNEKCHMIIFSRRDRIEMLYSALLRSHIGYNSFVLSPNYSIHVKNIEQVQYRFLWYVVYEFVILKLTMENWNEIGFYYTWISSETEGFTDEI